MTDSALRIRELRLAGVPGTDSTYGLSFKDNNGEWRPLSIIAGPSQTGKTSVADFIRYCLGDDEHPQHPEILGAVRSALLEIELGDQVMTIERAATGSPSTFASVWQVPLADIQGGRDQRISTEPPSDPEGLSQFVLGGFGLDGVSLPEAPTKEESRTHLLSIRDVFRVMFLPNERLDNKDLAYERSNFMVRQKFRQLVDVIFGVHDPEGAQLAASIKAATEAVNEAKRAEAALTQLANDDHPAGPAELQMILTQAETDIEAATAEIAALDAQQRTNDGALAELRSRLDSAQEAATRANVRVRDRVSLLSRLSALRAQYADDRKKLTFLTEAEKLFDPLNVVTCPACMSSLAAAPMLVAGQCSLCGSHVGEIDESATDTVEADGVGEAPTGENRMLEAELRAVSRRLTDLNEYWERLDRDRARLERVRDGAEQAAERAADAINQVAQTPAPWLAARDDVSARLGESRLVAQDARAGLKVWQRVTDAQERRERLELTAKRLREQRQASANRPDRGAVVRALSERFARILDDFDYPKLSGAKIDDNLTPQVRGLNYSAASSGGLVLISLAYHLAIWELAFERQAAAPGLLVIDSPQKNLGHAADQGDPDFADTRLVENFYAHVRDWLSTDGVGAQLIVIDNSPPESVADSVVVHYTRDPEVPPYGLITDAVD